MTGSGATTVPRELPLAPIQLVDVYVYDVSVVRRQRVEGDPAEPTARTTVSGPVPEEEGLWTGRISVDVALPFRPEALAEIKLSVAGLFSQKPQDPADTQMMWLLWPYTRAYVHEIGRMLGLPVPMLPMISVRLELEPHPDAEVPTGGERSTDAEGVSSEGT